MAARDLATWEHADRVQRYALALGRQARIVDEPLLHAIEAAAMLHDIGKLAIPDGLLYKPGPLTPDEYDQVKQHAVIGADLLAAVPCRAARLARAAPPRKLGRLRLSRRRSCGDIPVGARVLAIADCYDALTSNRPYRRALSHDSAVAMIHERRGSMFDPELTDAFLRSSGGCARRRRAIYRPAKAIRPPATRAHRSRRSGRAMTAAAASADVRTLPLAARAYVAAVVVAGAACFSVALAYLRLPHPWLFVVLLALAVATSAAKIDLPLGRSQSNLSLVARGEFLGAVRARAGADRLHRDRQRVGAVHAARNRRRAIRSTAWSSASRRSR